MGVYFSHFPPKSRHFRLYRTLSNLLTCLSQSVRTVLIWIKLNRHIKELNPGHAVDVQTMYFLLHLRGPSNNFII